MKRRKVILVLTCGGVGCAIGSLGGVLGALDGLLVGMMTAIIIIDVVDRRW